MLSLTRHGIKIGAHHRKTVEDIADGRLLGKYRKLHALCAGRIHCGRDARDVAVQIAPSRILHNGGSLVRPQQFVRSTSSRRRRYHRCNSRKECGA